MRLADTPNRFIAMNAKSNDSGITDAVMSDCADVAKEQEQDQRDKQAAFRQIPEHGLGRVVDDVALAVERPNTDAGAAGSCAQRQPLFDLADDVACRSSL